MSAHYTLFGNPVGHSKSPYIHHAFAAQTRQDLLYDTIEPALDGFADALAEFIESGGSGCNITAPFKMDACKAATERRPSAEISGASNCLKVVDGAIIAQNFDGIGLVRDIQINLGVDLREKRILLLGAGGATRGVVLPFIDMAPSEIVIANRTVSKAEDIAKLFDGRGKISGCGLDDVAGMRFDIVVNGTSASLSADEVALPHGVFGEGCLAYEMVYGSGLTPFLRQARDNGAAILADGVGMLVEQAAEAFNWWRGMRPDTRPVIDALTVPLVPSGA